MSNRYPYASKHNTLITFVDESNHPHYMAHCLDIPGCVTHGYTVEEAEMMIDDCIKCWYEIYEEMGRPIPEPKPLTEVTIDFEKVRNWWDWR